MKKFVSIVVFTCLFISVNAFAGLATSGSVVINENLSSANGTMLSARVSSNDVEFIGCGIKKNEGGLIFAFCQATDASGTYLGCLTHDEGLAETLYAMSDYSYIRFDVINVDEENFGTCTRIDISNQSMNIPFQKETTTKEEKEK